MTEVSGVLRRELRLSPAQESPVCQRASTDALCSFAVLANEHGGGEARMLSRSFHRMCIEGERKRMSIEGERKRIQHARE